MFKSKLKKAIEKYLAAETSTAKSAAKGVVTKTVNSCLLDSGILEEIQEVLAEFDELPEWIRNRFTPGSLYREGDLIFGWYKESQAQAENIPVDIPLCEEGYMKVLGNRDGFLKALPLPLGKDFTVAVPYEEAFTYAEYGYANACPLQWYRDAEGYKVHRSIIPHGFWQPWKWWDGAWHWYLKHRPELFEDFDCWGSRIEIEENGAAQPKPYDAVLGGSNKELWETRKFHLD